MKEREEFKQWLQGESKEPPAGKFAEESAEGWRELGVDKFDEILASIDKSIDEKTGRKEIKAGKIISFSNWKWMGIAASILLVAGAWWFVSSRPAEPEELFASYYQPRTHPDAMVRGEEDNIAATERKAVNAYVDGDYSTAIRQYENLLSKTPNDAKNALFLAISYLADGQENRAIALLDNFSADKNPYEADMRWYLALAYLKKGSLNTTKGLLENLASGNSYYAGSAKELLAAIK